MVAHSNFKTTAYFFVIGMHLSITGQCFLCNMHGHLHFTERTIKTDKKAAIPSKTAKKFQ